ncbi:DUF6624 domain-containing protein [Streptomyces noursei]|uniref:DUF6624 domain-containing protein n=1 Tax=Streptomyces noursei TaxID=1971 RepID=UPI0033206E44
MGCGHHRPRGQDRVVLPQPRGWGDSPLIHAGVGPVSTPRPSHPQTLKLITAVQAGEATRDQLAFLTDRVRVLAGRTQLYGTQFEFGLTGLHAYAVEAPEDLDARRAEMGRSPFDAFDKLVCGFYPLHSPPDSGSSQQ